MAGIPAEYAGWWRITETTVWAQKYLTLLGVPLLSLTGYDDRLRMHCLLAYVDARPTKRGVSFTWSGAWEFDQGLATIFTPDRPLRTISAAPILRRR